MLDELKNNIEKLTPEDLRVVFNLVKDKITPPDIKEMSDVIKNLYVFKYPWKSITELKFSYKSFVGWAEYPGVGLDCGSPRPIYIDSILSNPYIFTVVKTKLDDGDRTLGNSISCWTEWTKDYKKLGDPYIHPLQREIWRKFLLTEILEYRNISV